MRICARIRRPEDDTFAALITAAGCVALVPVGEDYLEFMQWEGGARIDHEGDDNAKKPTSRMPSTRCSGARRSWSPATIFAGAGGINAGKGCQRRRRWKSGPTAEQLSFQVQSSCECAA